MVIPNDKVATGEVVALSYNGKQSTAEIRKITGQTNQNKIRANDDLLIHWYTDTLIH